MLAQATPHLSRWYRRHSLQGTQQRPDDRLTRPQEGLYLLLSAGVWDKRAKDPKSVPGMRRPPVQYSEQCIFTDSTDKIRMTWRNVHTRLIASSAIPRQHLSYRRCSIHVGTMFDEETDNIKMPALCSYRQARSAVLRTRKCTNHSLWFSQPDRHLPRRKLDHCKHYRHQTNIDAYKSKVNSWISPQIAINILDLIFALEI